MPINHLAELRKQTEVGRIRIGQQVPTSSGKTRPAKLDKFRITTALRSIADEVADLYGGTVQPWKSPAGMQWEVFTDSASLPVIVPPQAPISQWMEMWSGGGCQRRCNGFRNILTDTPCDCPADTAERVELAADGKACKPTTRLNLMLANVRSVGVFRLESHGYYAAIELPGVAEVLASAGGYIPGRLELQQRSVKRPKRNGSGMETRQYMVPVLDVDVAPVNLVKLNAGHGAGAAQVTAGEQRQAIGSAPAEAPGPAAERVDWAARIAGVVDEASWRALRAEIQHGGELTPELDEAMMARAREIKAAQTQQAQAGEVVDAEVVDQPEQPAAKPRRAAAASAPADEMQVWQQILLAAAERKWTATETQKRMKDAIGVGVPGATSEQMAEFLHQIQNGGN